MATRLTRAEKKAETRQRLLDAAGRVFARRSFHGASVDEIAEEAGFSKGAVYSNFSSKEELFLALLERRIGERVKEISRIVESDAPIEQQLNEAARGFIDFVSEDSAWALLFTEFWAYAVRDPELRPRIAERMENMRAHLARMIEQRSAELGLELPRPAYELALTIMAMANGMAMEKLVAPDRVADDLYGWSLVVLFKGLAAEQEAFAR
jgi:AcrR family transcriptional regulator